MSFFFQAVWLLLRALCRGRAALALENLALRQQVAVLLRPRTGQRPRLRKRDRLFWIVLSKVWAGWKAALAIVKPETVIRWHRAGWRLYWRWKSKPGPGRPPVEREIRDLVSRMARENPLWGAPRIHSELELLGYKVDESTVSKYLAIERKRRPPSQGWRRFLKNHAAQIAALDFFTVPTATFRVLYVFLVLLHDRRRILHFNATMNPTAKWTAQQIVEAFPYETAPKYLLRDRDGIYGEYFRKRVKGMGIEEVLTTARSPWQNGILEREIGNIRRECLDHVIVLNEKGLRRILKRYFAYHHKDRPSLAIARNSPEPRAVEPRENGRVVAIPRVGGLHHRYRRVG
ncbi:MAG: integrase core domain-containing protein [Planctomycetota bacterium]